MQLLSPRILYFYRLQFLIEVYTPIYHPSIYRTSVVPIHCPLRIQTSTRRAGPPRIFWGPGAKFLVPPKLKGTRLSFRSSFFSPPPPFNLGADELPLLPPPSPNAPENNTQ